MRALLAVSVFIGLLSHAPASDEIPVESRVTSVDLFKNGLAVVRRTVEMPGPGTYRIENVPEPVHGTYWIESSAKVETRVTSRIVEEPVGRDSGVPFQDSLAGREVVVYFMDGNIPPASGRIASFATESSSWSRTYSRPEYYDYYYGYLAYPNRAKTATSSGYLILENSSGRSYVNASLIAHIQVRESFDTVKRRKPVLLLTASEDPAVMNITYLAKGMSWAPSYSVDMTDSDELLIRQKAVIRNELEPLEQTRISLISGFPNIPFAQVKSPLSPHTDLAQFFKELSNLNRRFERGHASMSNVVMQQAVSTQDPQGPEIDLQALAAGDGVDLHFQDIGSRTLEEGDSLALETASGRTPYQRIVEWIVPDTRTADGRYISEYERDQNPDKYRDAAWDALRFNNPFSFPMTTGSAVIVARGRFLGQTTSFWVSPGEETTLHVTKALNLRTRSVEEEEDTARDLIKWHGQSYYKVPVQGTLTVFNHRDASIDLVIRRRFSGELREADRSPECTLLEEGVYSLNKRYELTWNLSLEPGETAEIVYRYTVMVRH